MLNVPFLHALRTYREILSTGQIRSTADGENIVLDVRINVAGDMLVFICPRNNSLCDEADILELLQTDSTLEQQRHIAMELLRLKFESLALLPQSLVWLLNIGLSVLYAYLNSNNILASFEGKPDLAGVINLLPLVIIAAITPFLGRVFGFTLLKPLLNIIIRLVKMFRKSGSSKVE